MSTDNRNSVEIPEKPNSALSKNTKKFHFDRVFGEKANQADVYKTVVGPLIGQVMQVSLEILFILC